MEKMCNTYEKLIVFYRAQAPKFSFVISEMFFLKTKISELGIRMINVGFAIYPIV